MDTLESVGLTVSRNLYKIRNALIDATFLWHKENDPKGEQKSPYDGLLDQLPTVADRIEDACGYKRRNGMSAGGFVPNDIPYFWLGAEALDAR